MVRRRTRTKVATVGNGALLEDQYIASPKRKDCKIENGVSELYSASNSVALTALPMGEESKLNFKNKPPFARIRVERGCDFAEGTTGLPHGTRSQAKITETFFKSNTGTKNSKLKDVEEIGLNSTYSSSKPNYSDLQFETVVEKNANQNLQISQTSLLQGNTSHMQHDLIFGFIENSSTNNIFLQQPVLKLNIDKTPNQASSITIKRSIETDPVFSSPPLLTAPTFNVGANQVISLDSFSFASKAMLLPDIDSSSCDSGIAFTTSSDNNSSVIEIAGGSPTRRRKPATPHRIVCPSPIKAPSRALTDEGTCISTSVRNFTAAKEQLSPRKSQRHVVITASKTRRRLNHSDDKAPCIPINANTTMPSNCKQDVHLFENAHNRGHDENLKDVEARHATMPPSDAVGNKNLNASGKGQFKSHIVKAQQPKTKNKTSQPLATTNCNRELTEFFPVRRSIRKTKTAVKEEMMKNLEQAILEERAEGLKVAHFEGKGRGIVSDRRFQRGEFVVEYEGDLISMLEASEREKRYALDENAGCYMYYFKHKNQQYCIDATVDTGKLGRLVNHSRNGNLMTKVVVVKQRPHLILIAKDDIELGEELTYDYGDRSKESLMHHPWLAF